MEKVCVTCRWSVSTDEGRYCLLSDEYQHPEHWCRFWEEGIDEIAHSKLHGHSKATDEPMPSWKVVMVSEGGTKYDLISDFKTEAEAIHFAEAENWHYLDENRFEWRLEVEEDLSVVKAAKQLGCGAKI